MMTETISRGPGTRPRATACFGPAGVPLASRIAVKPPSRVTRRVFASSKQASDGDVLCWTGLDDGTVEVWRVAKNPYRTLESEGEAP